MTDLALSRLTTDQRPTCAWAAAHLHALTRAHQKVLELPGTGGQFAHHLVSTERDVKLQDNFTIACGPWQELTRNEEGDES